MLDADGDLMGVSRTADSFTHVDSCLVTGYNDVDVMSTLRHFYLHYQVRNVGSNMYQLQDLRDGGVGEAQLPRKLLLTVAAAALPPLLL